MDTVLGTKLQEQDKKIDAVRSEIVTVSRATESLNARILKVEVADTSKSEEIKTLQQQHVDHAKEIEGINENITAIQKTLDDINVGKVSIPIQTQVRSQSMPIMTSGRRHFSFGSREQWLAKTRM